jgi:dTDP-4-dehydrorhamnose 3,5-epimerase
MEFESTPLGGVYLLTAAGFRRRARFLPGELERRRVPRGRFRPAVRAGQPQSLGAGILRGLHYQTRHTQGKLVRVTAGSVFDVAVDLRRDSPTLGQWYGVTLDAQSHEMLWIPPGFAHGFYVLSEYADFLYKCTDRYDPDSEVSIAWDDPTLAIDWPLVDAAPPALSAKDAAGLAFGEAPLLR